MTTPGVRRFILIAHVTASVGWIGAVWVFMALAVIGLRSENESTVRTLVPFAFASLDTEPVALGSRCTRAVDTARGDRAGHLQASRRYPLRPPWAGPTATVSGVAELFAREDMARSGQGSDADAAIPRWVKVFA